MPLKSTSLSEWVTVNAVRFSLTNLTNQNYKLWVEVQNLSKTSVTKPPSSSPPRLLLTFAHCTVIPWFVCFQLNINAEVSKRGDSLDVVGRCCKARDNKSLATLHQESPDWGRPWMMAERWWDGKLNWFLNSLLLCFVSTVEQSSDITEMAAEEKGEKPKYEVEEISIKTRVQKILDLSTSRCINSPFNIVWTKGSQNGWHFGKASSFDLVLAICFDFFDKRLAFTFLTCMIKYSHEDKNGSEMTLFQKITHVGSVRLPQGHHMTLKNTSLGAKLTFKLLDLSRGMTCK